MIDGAACSEIIRTYAKHGWILRRVLLKSDTRISTGEGLVTVFGDIEITNSEIDAAWFSRPPAVGEIAWEIRHLSEAPFALLEYLDENADDFEAKLIAVESRLNDVVASRADKARNA